MISCFQVVSTPFLFLRLFRKIKIKIANLFSIIFILLEKLSGYSGLEELSGQTQVFYIFLLISRIDV